MFSSKYFNQHRHKNAFFFWKKLLSVFFWKKKIFAFYFLKKKVFEKNVTIAKFYGIGFRTPVDLPRLGICPTTSSNVTHPTVKKTWKFAQFGWAIKSKFWVMISKKLLYFSQCPLSLWLCPFKLHLSSAGLATALSFASNYSILKYLKFICPYQIL